MSLYQRLLAHGRSLQATETARIAATVAAARAPKPSAEPFKSPAQHWRDFCADYQRADQRALDLWDPGREALGLKWWQYGRWGYDEAAAQAMRDKWPVNSP